MHYTDEQRHCLQATSGGVLATGRADRSSRTRELAIIGCTGAQMLGADVAREVGWVPDRAATVRAALREANDGCAPEGPLESVIAIDGLPPQTDSQQHAVPVSLSLARFRSSTKLSKTGPTQRRWGSLNCGLFGRRRPSRPAAVNSPTAAT